MMKILDSILDYIVAFAAGQLAVMIILSAICAFDAPRPVILIALVIQLTAVICIISYRAGKQHEEKACRNAYNKGFEKGEMAGEIEMQCLILSALEVEKDD